MARFSKQDVTPNQQGSGTEWRAELDGYTVSMVAVGSDTDLTELLRGLPHDQCPSPHWGVVTQGSMWFRYGDRDEVFGAGDAFYVPSGHTAGATEGAEFVIFSPSEVMAPVEAHMAKRAEELFGARS
jgi:mannose-6-phosphate isomerase-like protein (cupin superfamily)